MAIRNILKPLAQGIIGKNLRKVAGNISSLIGGPNNTDSSDFAGINRTKQGTNMLSFPIDVANEDPSSGGNHGHYIMFFINEQENARLNFERLQDNMDGDVLTAGQANFKRHLEDNLGFKGKFDKVFDTKSGKFKERATEAQKQIFEQKGGVQDLLFGKGSAEYKKGFGGASLKTGDINAGYYGSRTNMKQTISVERAPTRRFDTVITLFMPAEVTVRYGAKYDNVSIGSLTQLGSQVLGETTLTGAGEVLQKNSGDAMASIGQGLLGNIIGNIPSLTGAREALELSQGAILADRMELAFKGIDKRTFTYTFKMMPRSKKEADEVKKIVDMFKFHMLPEMANGNTRGRLMSYPSTFDIKYMFQGNDNTYLNKVSECYLESMDVDYGGDRYRTHQANEDGTGAPPLSTSITLTFKEIELITRERAQEGF